ncbi:hypothetical protein C0Z20_05515 [Trinickia symbiotica]|uniref:Uncharacterized protein n=1 Tax=Trinickia symbiotica TaxID=863227 RepID=A0A2N7X8Y6_9BURK|nr:hypothetical protein C0Z20_05515 [Trinickia symbiotica]
MCNNSGGALVRRGPAYTELALFARVEADGGSGAAAVVVHRGIGRLVSGYDDPRLRYCLLVDGRCAGANFRQRGIARRRADRCAGPAWHVTP